MWLTQRKLSAGSCLSVSVKTFLFGWFASFAFYDTNSFRFVLNLFIFLILVSNSYCTVLTIFGIKAFVYLASFKSVWENVIRFIGVIVCRY